MAFSISEDIRPITDLKKHTRELIDQVRRTAAADSYRKRSRRRCVA